MAQLSKWIGFGASVFISVPISNFVTNEVLKLEGLAGFILNMLLIGGLGYYLWSRWFSKL